MPKVRISSPDFIVDIIDEPAETILMETTKVYRSVDGNVPIILSESDMLMNTVVEVSDSTYSTAIGTRTENDEVPQYTTRKDFVGDDIIYTGEAPVGSSEAAAVWRIYKLEFTNVEGDIKETWADASAQFTKVWDDRLTYTYL